MVTLLTQSLHLATQTNPPQIYPCHLCTALLRRCLCRLHHRGGHCSDCCSGLRRPLSAVGCCCRWVDDAAPIDKQWAAVDAVCAANTAALAACSVHHLPSLSASPRVCSLLATRDPPIDQQLTLKQLVDGAFSASRPQRRDRTATRLESEVGTNGSARACTIVSHQCIRRSRSGAGDAPTGG